jgi:Dullard-like phosphatase family protein
VISYTDEEIPETLRSQHEAKNNVLEQTKPKPVQSSIEEIEENDEKSLKTTRKSFGDSNAPSEQDDANMPMGPFSDALDEADEQRAQAEEKPEEYSTESVESDIEEYKGSFEQVLQKMRSSEGQGEMPIFLFQPNTNEMTEERCLLPPISKDKTYTLVLDLDETLIHFVENEDGSSQFLIRPYAQYFLKQMAKYYELVIFTAAVQDYADYILDRMDTEGFISYRLYRRHTNLQANVHQKDLSRIGRDLSKTLIVDNSAENFQLQPDNGVYIKSWYDDPNDKALKHLSPLLIGKSLFDFV